MNETQRVGLTSSIAIGLGSPSMIRLRLSLLARWREHFRDAAVTLQKESTMSHTTETLSSSLLSHACHMM